MQQFTESMRYEYPLKMSDLVIDVGGYEGRFANEIIRRYKCRVVCYEPVFYDQVKHNIDFGVTLIRAALGGENRDEVLHIKGDMTGVWADGEPVHVRVLNVNEAITEPVALMKLNCEGCEFEILEAILDRGNPKLFSNIQVQFHTVVPDFQKRWESIREKLLETHELTYDAPWCWENYKLK